MGKRDDLVERYRRGDVAAETSMAYSDCSTQKQRRAGNNNKKELEEQSRAKEREREHGFTDCLSA